MALVSPSHFLSHPNKMTDNGRIEQSIDSDEPPSLVVVRAIAAASNKTVQEFGPLAETITRTSGWPTHSENRSIEGI